MQDDTVGSYVPRLLLGRRLRELREEAGVRAEDAAESAGIARATLWRLEKGDPRSRYKPGDIEMLAQTYGADRAVTDILISLARATKTKSWFSYFQDVMPARFEMYVDLETYAKRHRWYEPELVPGLLQTPGYATAAIGVRRHLSNAEVRRRVELRMRRQEILTRRRAPASFEFVISESILVCPVGSNDTIAEQLRHLNSVSELPNITLRVVPFGAGMNVGMDTGMFEIFDLPASRMVAGPSSAVFIDQLTGSLFIDDPAEVGAFVETFDGLLDRALDESASRELIDRAARRFEQT